MTQPAYTYDELDQVLRGTGLSDEVGVSAIDGLIAALVAGPAFVDPQEWLPLIFAGRMPTAIEGSPGHMAVNTILNRYNDVSATLAERPGDYRPMFMNDRARVVVSQWAAGFIFGIGRRMDVWTSTIILTEHRRVLAPIFVSHDLAAGFLPDVSPKDQRRLRKHAHRHIADAVVTLRRICAPFRARTAAAGPRRPHPGRASSGP